jgi:hypothetical protein
VESGLTSVLDIPNMGSTPVVEMNYQTNTSRIVAEWPGRGVSMADKERGVLKYHGFLIFAG